MLLLARVRRTDRARAPGARRARVVACPAGPTRRRFCTRSYGSRPRTASASSRRVSIMAAGGGGRRARSRGGARGQARRGVRANRARRCARRIESTAWARRERYAAAACAPSRLGATCVAVGTARGNSGQDRPRTRDSLRSAGSPFDDRPRSAIPVVLVKRSTSARVTSISGRSRRLAGRIDSGEASQALPRRIRWRRRPRLVVERVPTATHVRPAAIGAHAAPRTAHAAPTRGSIRRAHRRARFARTPRRAWPRAPPRDRARGRRLPQPMIDTRRDDAEAVLGREPYERVQKRRRVGPAGHADYHERAARAGARARSGSSARAPARASLADRSGPGTGAARFRLWFSRWCLV